MAPRKGQEVLQRVTRSPHTAQRPLGTGLGPENRGLIFTAPGPGWPVPGDRGSEPGRLCALGTAPKCCLTPPREQGQATSCVQRPAGPSSPGTASGKAKYKRRRFLWGLCIVSETKAVAVPRPRHPPAWSFPEITNGFIVQILVNYVPRRAAKCGPADLRVLGHRLRFSGTHLAC